MIVSFLIIGIRNNVQALSITAAKTSTPITIDGNDSGSEWTGAKQVTIGAGKATLKIKSYRNTASSANEESIFLFIQTTDTTSDPDDSITLCFDILNSGGSSFDSDDVRFEIKREKLSGQVQITRTVYSGSTALWTPSTSQFEVIDNNSSWNIEIELTASYNPALSITGTDLNTNFLPSIVGFGVLVTDVDVSSINETEWPAGAGITNPGTWAKLRTRYPADYMLVLDQSGSMLSQDKWTAAKKASNIMVNIMSGFRNDSFNDKVGVTTFSWINPSTDNTSVPISLTNLPTFPITDFLPAPPVQTPESSYYTPIGKGLDKAFTSLLPTPFPAPDPETDRQKVVLLLSDGLHNRPTSDVPLLPSHLSSDYTPSPSSCSGGGSWQTCTEAPIQVNTVALGEDWGVDTVLLTNIKNYYAGVLDTQYQITGNAADLAELFINTLDDLYQFNFIPEESPASGKYYAGGGNQKLVMVYMWNTAALAKTLDVMRADTAGGTGTLVTSGVTKSTNTSIGFAIAIVDKPVEGYYWTVDASSLADPKPIVHGDKAFALVDLKLAARFFFDKRVHGTGQEIELKAIITEDGVPVIHDPAANPVTVSVAIKRPGEAFGHYVSTHSPDDCQEHLPELPSLPREQPDSADVAIEWWNRLTAVTWKIPGGDPKTGRYGLIDAIFEACNKDELMYVEDPGLDLYDDGTHGDDQANDGIYTLKFMNTEYEGSYVFRFKATGTAPSGNEFHRFKSRAEYVRTEVDPDESDYGVREIYRDGNTVYKEIYIAPKDSFSRYLGPGFAYEIEFTATAGNFTGNIKDYWNGYYGILLKYTEGKDDPVVTVSVQGKPKKIRINRPFEIVFPFVGYFLLDRNLNLDSNIVFGVKLGYKFWKTFVLEAEGGVTFTKNTSGDDGQIIQGMVNLRYDIMIPSMGNFTPFVTAGVGAAIFNDFGADTETVFAMQSGAGVTFRILDCLGLRTEARAFFISPVYSAPLTANYQGTVGLVFWF